MTEVKIGGPFEYKGSSIETTTSLVDLTNENSTVSGYVKNIKSRYPNARIGFFCDPWDDGYWIESGTGLTIASSWDREEALKQASEKVTNDFD